VLCAFATADFCSGLSQGIRVNKSLRATHSRREADKLIASGRVSVNGATAQPGDRLFGGDRVELDGRAVEWERLNLAVAAADAPRPRAAETPFVYLKYWKEAGVECTTNHRVRSNIIDRLGPLPGVEDRIVPIGRLDIASTGLILLTSDGAIINSLLRSTERKEKEYLVMTDRRASAQQIEQLRTGVVITTVAQRDGTARELTAPTKPCVVERIDSRQTERMLRFVLTEGRNRQIRRMCAEVGLDVVQLHRVGFAGIRLNGCARPGSWAFLTPEELAAIGAVSGL
jgi:23S rRNA pseudouridine2604 synthase